MDANASAIWLICALKQKKHPEGCFSCLAVGQGLTRAALPPRLSPYGRRRFAPASTSLARYVEPLRGSYPGPKTKKAPRRVLSLFGGGPDRLTYISLASIFSVTHLCGAILLHFFTRVTSNEFMEVMEKTIFLA
jgi:hypothetical protein